MTSDLNTVKTADAGSYHHGNLRGSLVASAEAILEERGMAGFSLRAAARHSGVSPAAPAHHFGDSRGLLTAVATRGFERLADQLARYAQDATGGDEIAQVGAGYLAFARQNPGVFSVMWAAEKLDQSNPAYLAAGRAAFNVLERAVTGENVAVADGPRLPEPETIAAWAMVHGLARLMLDGALDSLPERLVDAILSLAPTRRQDSRQAPD